MRIVLIQIYYQVILASKYDFRDKKCFFLCIIALIENICITMIIWYDKSQNYYQKMGKKQNKHAKDYQYLK